MPIEARYSNAAECETAVKNILSRPSGQFAFCKQDTEKK